MHAFQRTAKSFGHELLGISCESHFCEGSKNVCLMELIEHLGMVDIRKGKELLRTLGCVFIHKYPRTI